MDDIVKNARGPYIGKTVMICWEHKNIPLIIADMGLASKELFWGLDPESGVRRCAWHRCCVHRAVLHSFGELSMDVLAGEHEQLQCDLGLHAQQEEVPGVPGI